MFSALAVALLPFGIRPAAPQQSSAVPYHFGPAAVVSAASVSRTQRKAAILVLDVDPKTGKVGRGLRLTKTLLRAKRDLQDSED